MLVSHVVARVVSDVEYLDIPGGQLFNQSSNLLYTVFWLFFCMCQQRAAGKPRQEKKFLERSLHLLGRSFSVLKRPLLSVSLGN